MGFIESSDTLRFSSNKLLIELCGQLDRNLSKIESWTGVQIVRRGNALSIYGAKDNCDLTRKLISDLYSDLERGKTLDERELDIYFQQVEDEKGKQLEISLKYFDGKPVIKEISRVSKPGMRVYSSVKAMPTYKNNMGITILSTSKGVMTNFAAQNANLGGEILCRVY